MTNTTLTHVVVTSQKKWTQLALGLLCTISISSPQYVWALFTRPFMAKLNVPLAEIQLTFSVDHFANLLLTFSGAIDR